MAAATQTRAERIEEYVVRDAWGSVLYQLGEATSGLKMDDEDLLSNMSSEVISPIIQDLWPDDPDGEKWATEDNPEFEAAATRTMILEAAILAQLTTLDAQGRSCGAQRNRSAVERSTV